MAREVSMVSTLATGRTEDQGAQRQKHARLRVVGSSDEDDFDEGLLDADLVDEPLLEDEWAYHDKDDDDMISVTTTASESRTPSPIRFEKPDQTLEMVIEDSNWDNAEVLD
ncbi:MAG: hypothetical protein FRX48_06957 [Lasallia pustulata]|uniref:Uncharacterized protein n=1 Tax=Lasallia pustulata TaxID=136370 RepID=A0A5M8PLL7_9LECA|nr:MAG: hypothetical protein FRX48_06957 [Lasallia pustulata]